MKRSPLRRKTPLSRGSAKLARTARLPQRRATKRRSSRVHDRAYMAFVREQMPCSAIGLFVDSINRCAGVMEVDHVGARGLGQKCSDREVIALCSRHHADRHNLLGVFRLWDRARMAAFFTVHIERTQRAFARLQPAAQAA